MRGRSTDRAAIDHHTLMEFGNCAARGVDKEERQNGVREACGAAEHHPQRKATRVSKVREIALSNRSRVLGEQGAQAHVVQTSDFVALRDCEVMANIGQFHNNVASFRAKKRFCFMDKLDRKILDQLQRNCSLTALEIAERVGLSKAPCWRRIRALHEAGVVRQTVALLDAKTLNVGTTVFVMIKTAHHSAAWLDRFFGAVRDIPEIMELYRMSGDVDYLMRIVAPDIDAYDNVYKKLIAAVDFLDISASFAIETIKHTTALPLHYASVD